MEEPVELENAKDEMRAIFEKLGLEMSKELTTWAQEYLEHPPPQMTVDRSIRVEEEKNLKKKQNQLKRISQKIKTGKFAGVKRPSDEPLTSLKFHETGPDSDCQAVNTVEIDSFLYDDDDIDKLVDAKKISRTYCSKCGSRESLPLNFISHSLSRAQIEFIFTHLMPKDCQNVLDIGSRLGAIVYGSSIFNDGNVSTIGVEMDTDMVALTKTMIRQFGLRNLEIVENDVRNVPEVFKDNQLVVMNNVFSFFLSIPDQTDCWEYLHKTMRPGTILVHHPSVKSSTEHLPITFTIDDWLEEIDTTMECMEFSGTNEEMYEEMDSIKKYVVKKTQFNSV